MLKHWIAALGLAAAAGAGAAQAQTPSEATRWLAPLNVPGNGEITARAARIAVYNMGVRPARVALANFNNGARRNSDIVLVQPGRSATFPDITTATEFVVVVSDEPVVVSATIDRLTTFPPSSFQVVQPTDPGQITLQDQQNNHIMRGNFMPYRIVVREDVRVTPLACEGAPAGHFGCTINLPRELVSGNDRAPRPGENQPAPGPSRQPEGRYTVSPGAIPGNAPRMTPSPSPTPRRPR